MLFPSARYLIYFVSGSILIASITIIAEKKSPRLAGIVMSLPVITFLSLLFLAVSQGVSFSSKAAMWNPIGVVADLVYMGLFAIGTGLPAYKRKNKKEDKKEKIKEILSGLILGFIGYFSFVLLSSKFPVNSGWISLAILWTACIIFYAAFKRIRETKIDKLKTVSVKEIVFRGMFGGTVVMMIVILGDSTGYIWSGLFSSFPGTITPVLILLHLKNGKKMSDSAIKSSPVGLSGTGLFSFMVWLLYPAYGIIAGTIGAYLAVFLFLFIINSIKKFKLF